jgi:hypothetical protein
MRRFLISTISLACAYVASAHGDHGSHGQKPMVADDANWMTKHMAEEHHIPSGSWDSASFFSLHDYNGDGSWSADELLRTYGLMDESNKEISISRREEIAKELLSLLDLSGDGEVTREEWDVFISHGKTLPDMGTGPGHHGDDEYE